MEVDYSKWSEDSQLVLKNTAFTADPLVAPLVCDDTWRFALTNHYQISEKIGGFLELSYESSPVQHSSENYATSAFSSYTMVTVGIDSNITDKANLAFFLEDSFFTPYAHSTAAPNSNLKIPLNSYFLGAAITFDW